MFLSSYILIEVVLPSDSFKIQEFSNDSVIMEIEGQIDEVFHCADIISDNSSLKLGKFIAVEAVQPSCQIVHLIRIDTLVFKYTKNRNPAAYLYHVTACNVAIANTYFIELCHHSFLIHWKSEADEMAVRIFTILDDGNNYGYQSFLFYFGNKKSGYILF